LLGAGLPVNLTNDKGDTLLILGSYHQHPAVVRTLLDHGADVERVNDNGQTALGSATFRQNREIVELLLAAGAGPRTGARSALDVARFFNLHELQEILEASPPQVDS
jgi:ankyrin repeat protein